MITINGQIMTILYITSQALGESHELGFCTYALKISHVEEHNRCVYPFQDWVMQITGPAFERCPENGEARKATKGTFHTHL